MKLQVSVIVFICIFLNWQELHAASTAFISLRPTLCNDKSLKTFYNNVWSDSLRINQTLLYKKRQVMACCSEKTAKFHCCAKHDQGSNTNICLCSDETDCGRCPQDWIYYKSDTPGTEKCVKTFTTPDNYANALAECGNHNSGTLVKIDSTHLINFIKNDVVKDSGEKYWFKMKSNSGDAWEVNTGQTYNGDDNWATGVSAKNGDCGIVDGTNNAKWDSDTCTNNKNFICEHGVPAP